MTKTPPDVDTYLADGCGRCSLWKTPDCKVHRWERELTRLRSTLCGCGLVEEIKWSQPCYTFEHHNVVLLSAFKDYCALSFVKGTLLNDAEGILISPGENSQATRQLRFTDEETIVALEPVIKSYIGEAIGLEKAGLRVEFRKAPEPIPAELQKKFDEDPTFQKSFKALTPGRQRAYILHFSSAKQSTTREARIEKCLPGIMAGKGLND